MGTTIALVALFLAGGLAGCGGTVIAQNRADQEAAWYAFAGGIFAGLLLIAGLLHALGGR
jgi:hypothetical protein